MADYLGVNRPLRIGLAGFGFWGTKLARNIDEAPGAELAVVADSDAARRADAEHRHRAAGVQTVDEMVANPDLDALVLATPAGDHHAQARRALIAGKHVLVEKPLALTVAECDELIELADTRGLVLMTGHTFLYSAPVQLIRGLIERGELGQLLYCSSQRLNLGAIRTDTSAMWDLAPHDISILLTLLGDQPSFVSAQQFSLIDEAHEDIAMLTMAFASGPVGHVQVSRLDPRKVRELTIVGSKKMVVYDDTDGEMPVRIYDKGVADRPDLEQDLHHGSYARHNCEVRSGDMVAPTVVGREPLRVEIEDFIDSIVQGREPVSGGQVGRDVVAVLEAAERSAALGGEPMTLNPIASDVRRLAA
jgi:predicted dehydrogenase